MAQINPNWFPGHMKKALNNIKKIMLNCDGVIEIVDSRLPLSSMPTNLDNLINNKKRFLVFSKYDLADINKLKSCLNKNNFNNTDNIFLDLRNKNNIKKLINKIETTKTNKDIKYESLNLPSPIKYYIVIGIPNVGKSTLINSISNKKKAEVENKPGKTRSEPLIKISNRLYIYDTPGILEPKYEDKEVMLKLALIGSVKESVFLLNQLAEYLYNHLNKLYPNLLDDYYKVKSNDYNHFYLEVAKKRNMYINNFPDINRSMLAVINELRNGKIGRVCLDE